MDLSLVSCGIFRYELEKVLPEIEAELGCKITTDVLAPALDANAGLLENSVAEKLALHGDKKTILLYGSMCHTEWPRIIGESGVVYPKAANCAEMLLSPEKKRRLTRKKTYISLRWAG